MSEGRKFEVSTWIAPDQPDIVEHPAKPLLGVILPARTMGAIGTLLAHAVVAYVVVFNLPYRTDLLDTANLAPKPVAPVSMEITQISVAGPPRVQLKTADLSTKPADFTAINEKLAPHFEIETDSGTAGDNLRTDSGSSDLEHLATVYSGQIFSRIERLWLRPTTPVDNITSATRVGDSPAAFRCQVKILQLSDGRVEDVTLLRCNGSVDWRQSLVTAIRQSSPLPAPPDPRVYDSTVTVTFVAFPSPSNDNQSARDARDTSVSVAPPTI